MDKQINPKLRMEYPYSLSGKVRLFPGVHYFNTSMLTRIFCLLTVPSMFYACYKIQKVLDGPGPKAMQAKRKAIFGRRKPFKTITEEQVQY